MRCVLTTRCNGNILNNICLKSIPATTGLAQGPCSHEMSLTNRWILLKTKTTWFYIIPRTKGAKIQWAKSQREVSTFSCFRKWEGDIAPFPAGVHVSNLRALNF